MAGGWGSLQSLIRQKNGKEPDLKLELAYDEDPDVDAEEHENHFSSRLPALSARGSKRGSLANLSRADSPEFSKAVAMHNDKLMTRQDSSSTVSSMASDPEVRGEQRVRHSMIKVVARGRGSGLLPGEDFPATVGVPSEPHSPKQVPAGSEQQQQASLGSLMHMVKLKKTVVPKLAAAARLKTKTAKRTSQGPRGSFNVADGSFNPRTTIVPASLHTSLHNHDSLSGTQNMGPGKGGLDQSLVSLSNIAASPARLQPAGSVSPPAAEEAKGARGGLGPRESNAMQSLTALKNAKRAGRLFLRLAGPDAKKTFLKAHPFFRGTSDSLRERLAPQLVRRSVENASSEVLVQGEEPHGSTDYLFLTSPDFAANIEVTLDNYPIAALSGDAVFGQEAIFGITKAYVFGIRVPADAVHALWVIPRKTLKGLLVKDMFSGDARILRERAHSTAVALLRAWYLHPISHVKIRLFDNAEHAFKHCLVQAVEMRLVASGASVCTEQDNWSSCFCIFRGEAHVKVGSAKVARLAHAPGTSAWAAWWGTLEILGIVDKCSASVEAVTDCIVWQLPQERLTRLRRDYPMECTLFDKVAVEHMKVVQPYAMSIAESTYLRSCDPRFLQELDTHSERRIYSAGQVVIRESEMNSDEIYVLVRGKAEVRKSLRNVVARSAAPSRAVSPLQGEDTSQALPYDPSSTVPVATLAEGAMFGEIAALGVRERRTATVVCSTICDVRVVKSVHMVQALTHFPDQGLALEKLSDNQMSKSDEEEMIGSETLSEEGLFTDFSTDFLDKLGAEMSNLVAFSGQPIIEQGAEVTAMFVLMQGRVAIEIETARVCDFRAPAVIGELSLLTEGTKSLYTVRSRTHCHFKLIVADRGRELLESFPEDHENLTKFSTERLDGLRNTICNKYHGVRPSVIAEKQASVRADMDDYDDDDSSADGETPPNWWVDTIFKESDQDFIDFLSENLQKLIYFNDEVILREGDEGDSAIILQVGGGIVEVGGVRVGEVKAGSIVGEAVMLGYATLRTATVRAVGLTSAVSLSRSIVLEALQQHPEEMQRVEHMMMIRSSTNKMLTNKDTLKTTGASGGISIGGLKMGIMGGSAIKTMNLMAQRRSTTTLDVGEIQRKLDGRKSGRNSACRIDRNDGSESPPDNLKAPRSKMHRISTALLHFNGNRAGSRRGSRVASRQGSRAGSPVRSRQGSRQASRAGSLSSGSDDSAKSAQSRVISLKGARLAAGVVRHFTASPRHSVDMSSAGPFLQSEARAAARKLKKQLPAISVVNMLGQSGDETQGAEDADDAKRNATIAGIAEQMLRAPKARPMSVGTSELPSEKTHHESLSLPPPRSSTVLGLRQGRGQGPANPFANAVAAITIAKPKLNTIESHEEVFPEVPADTDIEMDADDLKVNLKLPEEHRISLSIPGCGSSNSHRVLPLKHRKTDSQPCVRSGFNSSMSQLGDFSDIASQASVSPEDGDSLNLDDADLDCDIDDRAMQHTMLINDSLLKEAAPNNSEAVDWVEKRKKMIEAAPMKQACRLARRGDFLPLVPENKGYHGDSSVPRSSAAKIAARRCGTGAPGTARRLLRAQGVYLSARRWDMRKK